MTGSSKPHLAKKQRASLVGICAGSLVVSVPQGARAQDADQQSDAGDIIVTARKREESILQVPLIASVLSGDQLERRQVTDLVDVAALTPGLVLGTSALEVGTQISIRGVGTSSIDPGIDQSISLNLDGLQVSQGSAYSVGVFDMAQIEVLKGPQALFFGKNSPGGVVAIRTADPGDELEVIGRVGHEFVANEWRGEAILSAPVTDSFGLRLSTLYSDREGFFRNTAVAIAPTGAVDPADRFGSTETLYGRLTALLEPSSRFTARLKLNYTRDRNRGGAPEQLTSCPEGLFNYLPAIGIPLPSMYSSTEDCKGNRTLNIVDVDPAVFQGVPNNGVGFTHIDQYFGTLELKYELSPQIEITSVSGYYNLKVDAMQNGPWVGGAAPSLVAVKHFRRREFTQELRLNSDFGSVFDFTAGGFYQNAELTNQISLPGNILYGLPPILLEGSHDVDIESLSLFGQLRYRPTPKVEIAAGARWTDERRSDAPQTVDLFGQFGGAPGSIVFPQVPRLRSRNWSPEVTVTYLPTDDLTLFSSVKQGYKSGSYNLIVPVNPGQDNSFGDEKVRGGEVGIKARLADRQLYLNVAGYYYKYSGLQVGVNEPAANGLPILTTFNAGAAKVYGVDVDFRFLPQSVPGLEIAGAVNWNRARFTRFENSPCFLGQTIAEGCTLVPSPVTDPAEIAAGYFAIDPATGSRVRYNSQDLSGTRLPRAPNWQVTLGVNYEMPVGKHILRLGADGQFSSRYITNLGRQKEFFQDVT